MKAGAQGLNFYPRPPRGGRHLSFDFAGNPAYISIHALREEGDGIVVFAFCIVDAFLSTPSARRATSRASAQARAVVISIHALREEGDSRASAQARAVVDFYPRPPRGGRHGALLRFIGITSISIHALREEGDGSKDLTTILSIHFYPRPPRGGRLWRDIKRAESVFISIHALREEGDHRQRQTVWRDIISIHALREEGDDFLSPTYYTMAHFYPRPPRGGRPEGVCTPGNSRRHFYPRPPRGGRPVLHRLLSRGVTISIHALREEGDGLGYAHNDIMRISIHALREEGDSVYITPDTGQSKFLSTPSARRATRG